MSYETGAHGESIDVGLAVTDGAMGVVIEAPQLGRLRAALELTEGGAMRLAALSRRTEDGVETEVLGLGDEAQLAQLQGDLSAAQAALAALEIQAKSFQEAARIAQAEIDLAHEQQANAEAE